MGTDRLYVGRRISLFVFVLLLCTSFVGYLMLGNSNLKPFASRMSSSQTPSTQDPLRTRKVKKFTVNTPGCRIREYNPYDLSIAHLVKRLPSDHIKCDKWPLLTYSSGDLLMINKPVSTEIKRKWGDYRCCYKGVYRKNGKSDDAVRLDKRCRQMKFPHRLTKEMNEVRCKFKNGTIFYTNYHAVVKPEKIPKNVRSNMAELDLDHYSVLILGVDSISRLNFHRQMKSTLEMLRGLGAFELKAYNKVGINTLPNVAAMLTGSSLNQLKNECSGVSANKSYDKCDLMWKEYKEANYVTMYAEDSPTISTFNYLQNGFMHQPTDHYLRPMLLRAEEKIGYNKPLNCKLCIGPITQTELLLKYISEYAEKYKSHRSFAFSWINSLTHDFLNYPSIADGLYLQFLKNISESGAMDSTIIFFLSDHGIRWGKIVETEIGHMEERLPFAFVLLPQRFKNSNPKMVNKLRINANRLVTPYDIHATLRHILNLENNSPKSTYGQSLFNAIPANRTCHGARVPEMWCACLKRVESVGNEFSINAGNFLVDILNQRLKDYRTQCHELRLRGIEQSSLLVHRKNGTQNEEELCRKRTKRCDYTIIFTTKPGKGRFEAIVRRYERGNDDLELIDEIVRLSLYDGTGDNHVPSCIDPTTPFFSRTLLEICQCKQ